MRLFFDLDSGELVTAPGTRQRLTSLSLKRGDTLPIRLTFLREGVGQELPALATGQIGMKERGDFDGPFVASAPEWAKVGTGSSTYYALELDLNTVALDELLGVGDAVDVASVQLNMELEFVADGQISSSNTVLVTVANDVVKGNEGTPLGPATTASIPPVNAVFATGTTGFVGTKNAILYTATLIGAAGNSLSRRIIIGALANVTTVSVSGSLLTITAGGRARVRLTPEPSPDEPTDTGSTSFTSNITLVFAGIENGAPAWSEDGNKSSSGQFYLYYTGTVYRLDREDGDDEYSAEYGGSTTGPNASASTVATGSGFFAISYLASTAAEAITAINASAAAAELMTAVAVSGSDSTGALESWAETSLSGGVTGTAGYLGTILMDSTHIYVATEGATPNNPNWRQIAHSAIPSV